MTKPCIHSYPNQCEELIRTRGALRDLLAWADRTRHEYPEVRTSRAIDRARRELELEK